MYRVIQLTDPTQIYQEIGLYRENGLLDITLPNFDQVYQEAVFTNGKKTIAPVIERMKTVKDRLEREIAEQDLSVSSTPRGKKPKMFNPEAFWRCQEFKELEDTLAEVFGFRNVEVHPFIEKYSSKEKMFESKELNCYIYNMMRYPIEGLVTDNGFYDHSKSIIMQLYISLGLIKALAPEEITAVLLHEFGHSVDPAIVDIKYTEVSILAKYMTDRKKNLTKEQNRYVQHSKLKEVFLGVVSRLSFAGTGRGPFGWLVDIFSGKEKAEQRKLERIRKMLQEDKSKFTRQEYSEAYADNFARMYGMAGPLASGLRKMSKSAEGILKSRIKREAARQEAIVSITRDAIKDVHKTDIHRVRALIREYKLDLSDPNTPEPVKAQMREDLRDLEKVLDQYMNNFDEFQNKVNRVINEELAKMEDPIPKTKGGDLQKAVEGKAPEQKAAFKEAGDHQDAATKESEKKESEFVPVFGIAKMYSDSKLRADGSEKSASELNSISFRKKIAMLTRGDHYSHALISFNEDLSDMYSYEGNGLVKDNINTVTSWLGTEAIYVCVMFVTKEERDKMKKYIQDHLEKPGSTKYSFSNMWLQNFGTPKKIDGNLICSTFTGFVLNLANPKNLHRDYSRLRPEDITILPRSFYVGTYKNRLDFQKRKAEVHSKMESILRDHKEEIEDYNNHLPKMVLQDRIDKLGSVDKIIAWCIDKFTGGSDHHDNPDE